MITVTNLSLGFSGDTLFKDVNLKFNKNNCYGIIGANGAGKSTFLRILSGERECSGGDIAINKNARMSVLKQDQFEYDDCTVLDTIIAGNPRIAELSRLKDAIYSKPDFSDADGETVGALEGEFAEIGGWEAEADAGKMLQLFGLSVDLLPQKMSALGGNDKVKILLCQALFGKPDILVLDEPTNHLDIAGKNALEDFLLDFEGTVIVVSHDRHFLNTVCTHIVDIDYKKMKMYVGNYDFWLESSRLIQTMLKDQKSKNEDKAAQLKSFIARFSANKSKAKQATSRKKLLEKLDLDDLPSSSRKSPYVGYVMSRELGKDILEVENLSKTIDGVKVLNNIGFRLNRAEKIALVGENDLAHTALLRILADELKPDAGVIKWGISTTRSHFPKDNSKFFDGCPLSVLDWLKQYGKPNMVESEYRGFLARMLFEKDEMFKELSVLSGGERVRCMLSKMMLKEANVLILDQPTNHLDLEAISALNGALIDFKGVVIFASHDYEFVNTIANRIMEVDADGKLKDYMQTYEQYIANMKKA
jgi:ATPase subunit of ABC transporter with duplicated ATPase domains